MNREQPPRRHFHDELDELQERLLEMAGLVEDLISQAVGAVREWDASAAKAVRKGDDRVDELEVEIDERVVELLALQQPVATDLRQIIATNKLSNDLERMGDHAVNIAKAAKRLRKSDPLPEVREFADMAEAARAMVSDALAAYVSRDVETARRVCIADDHVDRLRRSIFGTLLDQMTEDPKRIGGALQLLLVSQNLERIADLATNICEDIVFLVEGHSIKHGLG